MTDEEKKAIEILETLSCYGLSLKLTDENIKAIDITLDLIEKQKDKIIYYEDIFSALEEYYSITIEDIEKCVKEDK